MSEPARPTDPDELTTVELEWREEIRRRLASLDDGTAVLVDPETAKRRVRALIEQHREG